MIESFCKGSLGVLHGVHLDLSLLVLFLLLVELVQHEVVAAQHHDINCQYRVEEHVWAKPVHAVPRDHCDRALS